MDDGKEVLKMEGGPYTLRPYSRTTEELTQPWIDPILWSPLSPHLYTMKVELLQRGSAVDTREERFGFREFWIDGTHFVLNGKKITFLATAGHPPDNSTKEDAAALYKSIRGANCTAMRLHANLWPEWWYDAADETGMLLIEESAIWCFGREYALSTPEFWKNAEKHLAGMVKRDKNHPSVVMYSVENEILHTGGERVGDCSEKLAALGRFLKALDPTRPIMYEGDEDPQGAADVINLHYPHEFPRWNLYPNTCYWLEKRTKVSGYPRREWEWSRRKPLYIGEFLWSPGRTPDPFTLFVGSDAYKDFNAARSRAKAAAWIMQIQAYRALDVAGMCPWTLVRIRSGRLPSSDILYDAVKYAYEPNAAFIEEYDSRFFEGESVKRTVYLYNDTYMTAGLTLQWELSDGKKTLDSGVRTFRMKPAEKVVTNLTLHMPPYGYSGVSHPLKLTLTVKKEGKTVFTDTKNYRLFPKIARHPGGRFKVAVYEKDGKIGRFLEESGLEVKETREPWKREIPAKVCIIGPHMLDSIPLPSIPTAGSESGIGETLRNFVRRGGNLIVLEQNRYPPNVLPVSLTDYACTIAFKRADPGGLFTGIRDGDFRFWRGNNVVASKTIAKPNHGPFRAIVDAGGPGGLIYACVIEVPAGKGRYLLSQLLIGEKLRTEPVAGRFLLNLVNYAHEKALHPSPRHTLALMGKKLERDLDRIDLVYTTVRTVPDPRRHPLLLIDGSELAAESRTQILENYVRGGGTLLLHAVEPSCRNLITRLLGSRIVLRKSKVVPVLLGEPDTLTTGLSNQELYWLGPHTGDRRSRTPLDPGIVDYIPTPPLPPLQECNVVEAETMKPESTTGITVSRNGVHMYAASAVSTRYEFPRKGKYIIGIFAAGTPVEGVYPEVTIYLDGERVGGVMLTRRREDVYYASISAPGGEHVLRFAFTNDAYAPERGEDRNLFLDKVAIAPLDKAGFKEILNPPALTRIECGKGKIIIDLYSQASYRARWEVI